MGHRRHTGRAGKQPGQSARSLQRWALIQVPPGPPSKAVQVLHLPPLPTCCRVAPLTPMWLSREVPCHSGTGPENVYYTAGAQAVSPGVPLHSPCCPFLLPTGSECGSAQHVLAAGLGARLTPQQWRGQTPPVPQACPRGRAGLGALWFLLPEVALRSRGVFSPATMGAEFKRATAVSRALDKAGKRGVMRICVHGLPSGQG